jgi:CRP/FNR family transcriptional regulator, cyclic AMP receptor protein
VTHPPTMPHHVVREHRVVLLREESSHVGFDLVWVLLGGPSEAPRQASEMSVDGDPGHPEGIAQHNVRSLPSYARQTHERIKIRRYLTREVITKPLPDELDRLCLLSEEARGGDEGLQLLPVCARIARRIRIGIEKRRCHFVDPLIGALRAQDCGNQQLQRGPEVQFTVSIGVGLGKRSENRPGLRPVRCVASHTPRVCVVPTNRCSASLPLGVGVSGETRGWFVDDVLAGTPLFSALDPQGAEALRVSLQEIRVAKGQELFREGEPGDHLYLILDGKVKLGHGSPDGRESLMAILGPGEMFGELSLFDPGLRTSTATALTEANVLALGNEQLMPLLEGRPEVAAALLQALARRLRRTNEAMADLVFSDVPGRVAKALMELGEKFGTLTPEGLLVTHDMTQEELAQLVGASRETVNKALAEFGHRGWIKLESRQVLITDVERLGKRAR